MSRGGLASLLVAVLTTALVAAGPIGLAGAEGAPHRTATPSTASTGPASSRPVLKSDYGRATSRVHGTFGKHGTVTGTFTPRHVKVGKAGNLRVIGRLEATMTRGNGHVVGTHAKRVTLTVAKAEGQALRAAAGSCDVLNLVLGPLDLDLLGLQVHLDKVVLNIVAASGAGNLLGTLLCAVAGLLDQDGVLTQVSQILNSILAILRL